MKLSTSLNVALLSLLSACGGGGGSGGGGGGGPAAVGSATLTSANQHVAAQDSLSASFLPLSGPQFLTGAQSTDETLMFRVARKQVGKLSAYFAAARAGATVAGAIASETEPCSFGGSATLSVADADASNSLSTGDRVSISFAGCTEADGTINGGLSFTINTLSGDYLNSFLYSMGIDMSFSNFTVASGGFSGSVSGDMELSVASTAENAFTDTITATALTVSGTYSGVTRTRTLANFSATETRAPSGVSFTTRHVFSGTLTSSTLSNQSISFTTPTAFVVNGNQTYPSTGVMLITGANNGKLRVTAISNTQVTEELDAAGDGTYETSTTVLWSSLL